MRDDAESNGDAKDPIATPDPSTMSDVRQARVDDAPESWRRLFPRISARIKQRHSRTRLPVPYSVEDLVQETLLDVCRNLAGMEPGARAQFWGWVDCLADAKAIDLVRRANAVKRRCDMLSGGRPEDVPDGGATQSTMARLREIEAKFANAIRALSPRQEMVLRLRILRGLSYEEIAREMGYQRPDTVRVLLLRARRKLAFDY